MHYTFACYTLLHQVDYVIHGRTPIKPCPDGSDPYQVNTHTHYMCSVYSIECTCARWLVIKVYSVKLIVIIH